MQLSRRALLGTGAASLLASAVGGRTQTPKTEQRVKNIIFCVADGMAIQTLSMSDQFQRYVHGRRSYWSWLMQQEDVVTGLQVTSSLTGIVTDSAAASCAWASGRHIWNGQVNMYPDGTKLTPIAHLMKDAGMKIGLATTTRITHATPAGFATQNMTRDDEDSIAPQFLTAGVDVLMGGGSRHFDAASRKDKQDLFGKYATKGYMILRERSEMLDARSEKILGLFSSSHIPYSVDWENSPELQASVPTLAEMSRVAINNLKDHPKGFLLQIEGGRVDHGGHANDLAALVYDQIAFEHAVEVAIEFARRDGETLVVITTDHACGGPSLNGAGQEYFDATEGFKTLTGMTASYEGMSKELDAAKSASQVQDLIKAKLGLGLSTAEAQGVVDAAAGKSPFALSSFLSGAGSTLATILGNHSKVLWTSGNHTAEHCVVSAFGPGSKFFHGVNDNISYFDHMLSLRGLKHSNPQMSFEEAQKARAKAGELGLLSAVRGDCDETIAEHCLCHH